MRAGCQDGTSASYWSGPVCWQAVRHLMQPPVHSTGREAVVRGPQAGTDEGYVEWTLEWRSTTRGLLYWVRAGCQAATDAFYRSGPVC